LLPSKDPESTSNLLPNKDVLSGDPRNRRRLREEPEAVAEGGGEGMSTASVALKIERYRPRIYGFQINEIAKLQRWQEAVRDR
jgi:casein kinase II subunit beta